MSTANSALRIRDIVINEIMFNPITDDNDHEFIELYNKSTTAQHDVSGWKLHDAVGFTIPSGTIIQPNSYLVIAENESTLRSRYPGVLTTSNTKGNYSGNLKNSSERIALLDNNGVLIDEVLYYCGGRWGKWSDGGGSSLELIDAGSDNRLPSNWADSTDIAPITPLTLSGARDNGLSDPDLNIGGLEVAVLGPGECVIDNVSLIADGVERIVNGTFETDASGAVPLHWQAKGTHSRSEVTDTGVKTLKIAASGRGDTGRNITWANLNENIPKTGPATITAQAQWLRGRPQLLFRLHGNYMDGVGNLTIPDTLGSPGQVNTAASANAGPAIYDVIHSPLVPAVGQNVSVSARFHDTDGIQSRTLRYRLDPSPTFVSVTMVDDGTSGDAIAADGIFSATVPAQSEDGKLVEFYIESADLHPTAPLTSRFPTDAPARECVIRFGESRAAGKLGMYRFWLSTTVSNLWRTRSKLDNTPLDTTFVYGESRAIYNVGSRYAGSPATANGYDSPAKRVCGYALDFPPDDRFLGATDVTIDWPIRDPAAIRESVAYWIAGQMGLPDLYRRPVQLNVNGTPMTAREQWEGGALLFEDIQQPDRDVLTQWFPNSSSGHLHKLIQWYEYYNQGDTPQPPFMLDSDQPVPTSVAPTLDRYLTTVGSSTALKKARYRWNWPKRAEQQPRDDDYNPLFGLVEAVNTYRTASEAVHLAQIASVIDVEQWMCHFAYQDVLGNWDSFGNSRTYDAEGGKNSYAFKPRKGKWNLIPFDLDVTLANGFPEEPQSDLFACSNEPNVAHLYQSPVCLRAYWRAMLDATSGPMLNSDSDQVIDQRWAAIRPHVTDLQDGRQTIKSWLSERRSYILGLIPSAIFSITSSDLAVNPVIIDGTAPVTVKTIKVEVGASYVEYPVTWTSTTAWRIRVPIVVEGDNIPVRLRAFDRNGIQIGSTLTV